MMETKNGIDQKTNTAETRSNLLAPKLRFREFDGFWKKSILDNVAKRGSGHTPSKNFANYYNGGIKWVSLADSKKLDNGYIEDTEIKISLEGIKKSSAVLHPKESVLLSRDAGVGKSAVMKSEMAVSQHFIVWQGKDYLLSNWFLYHILQILKPEFERIAVGSTIKTIGLPYFKKLEIVIPTLPEQQKIASFLSAVDEKIQQLTRKKELLEQYKKGVMQNLFSGKLRFKDENGGDFPDWEEKRLGEVCEMTSSKRVYLSDYVEQGIPFYRGKEITELKNNQTPSDILYISESRYEDYRIKFGVPQKNDILITAVGTLGNVLRIRNNDKFYFKDGNLIWLRNIKLNVNYLEILIGWNKPELIKTSIGSTQRALTMVELRKIKINVPCIDEQQKIASYLSSIDTKIESVGNYITQTQTYKKGLLQQMFV